MVLLSIIIIWRIGLFLISFLAQVIYEFTPKFPYSDVYLLSSHLPQWVWSWANFDGVHYLTIAQRGYLAQFTQAFFPLYPLVLRIISMVTQDQFMIISGVASSFIFFVIAILFFRKLLLLDYSKLQTFKIILLLLVFPTSFYFAALYTESLFFLLTILAFWFARNKKWFFAGICGLLASATRITGIFLFLPLVLEWFILEKKLTRMEQLKNRMFLLSIFKSPVFYLVPLGLLAYMFYLQVNYHDALYFWHAQPAFGADRSVGIILPPQVVWRYMKILATVKTFSYVFWYAVWELGAYVSAVILLYVGHRRKIRLSYLLFGWLVIIIPALTGTFSSMPRYVLLAFPLYIVVGTIKNKYLFSLIFILSCFLLLLLTLNFSRGLWVA